MTDRLVFWFGQRLGRTRARHPALFWTAMYACVVTGGTLGLHYIARPDGNSPSRDITFSWGGSLAIAVVIGFVGVAVAKLVDR